MRKGFLIVLVVVLAAAFAAPAMAGTDINGFYKSRAFLTNYVNYYSGAGAGGSARLDAPYQDNVAKAYVEQRVRLKMTTGEENVKAVFHFEENSIWGDSTGGGRLTGGGLTADAVNLQTKSAYVWFKVPNTSVDFTVGIQPVSDSYAYVFMGVADMAGVFMNGRLDPVSYRLGWSKWSEGNLTLSDDRTFYLAEVKFTPTKEVKLGANFYVLEDDRGRNTGSTQRIYMPGFDATFGAGPATINAWGFYQFGKFQDFGNSALKDIKIGGFATDVRADLNAGPGKAFVEALYISGGDNNSVKYKSIVDSGYTNSVFIRTDMQILFLAADVLQSTSGLYNTTPGNGIIRNADPASIAGGMGNGGRGLTHLATGFTMKLGDQMSAKVGAGYLAATKMLKSDPGYMKKSMGTEVNGSLNYSIYKGLDVGLVGAYAWLGDFFKRNPAITTQRSDPRGAYDLHARIGYTF
jgi:hypothetical protein